MINTFNRSFSTLIAALLLVAGAQEAGAWPSGSGGGLRLWGSSVDIDFTPVDIDGRPPVQWIYYDDSADRDGSDGRYCASGQVQVTIEDLTTTPSTATAWYEFVNDPSSTDTTPGVCFFRVTQGIPPNGCPEIPGANVGAGTAEDCEYTVPSLDDVYTADGAPGVKNLLQGMMQLVPGTGTGFLAPSAAEACEGSNPNKHCAIRFGFDFDAAPPTSFFPATVTDNLDPVGANVTLFANEVCTEFLPADLDLDITPAVEAKLSVLRSCEPLAMSLRVCTDINSADPKCDVDAGGGQQTTGSAQLLVGDFLNPEGLDATCISSIEDLQGLTTSCDEPVRLAVCEDSNGLMEMPTSLLTGDCGVGGAISGETLVFGTPDGGGSVTLEISSISSQGSPGFPGTSNIPAVSPDLMAIISTPASTEDNDLDFRDMSLLRVAYIDGFGGNDVIIGSKHADTIRGSSGVDTLSGHLGNDVLQGGDGDDTLNGDCVNPATVDPVLPIADGCGDDGGDDLLLGYECFGTNADCSVVLNKGAEVDTLYGGPGNDILDGGRGNDILEGGDGKDAFVLWGDPDTDTMVDYDKTEGDVIVNLTGNTVGIQWDGKRNSGVCKITVGGNNAIIDATITNANSCKIENYDIRVDFPEGQGAGHPYTFQ